MNNLSITFEPMMGLEPMTSSLPRKYSTTELHRLLPINTQKNEKQTTKMERLSFIFFYSKLG